MDNTTTEQHVAARYQGVFQPLIRTDELSEGSTPPAPPENIYLESGAGDILLEDGGSLYLEG